MTLESIEQRKKDRERLYSYVDRINEQNGYADIKDVMIDLLSIYENCLKHKWIPYRSLRCANPAKEVSIMWQSIQKAYHSQKKNKELRDYVTSIAFQLSPGNLYWMCMNRILANKLSKLN